MRYFDLLLEYDQTTTLKNWGPQLLDAVEKDPTWRQDPDWPDEAMAYIVRTFEAADPTPTKSYVLWLIRQYLADSKTRYIHGSLKFEDIGTTIAQELANYHRLKITKQLPPDKRDINRLSWRDLREFPQAALPEKADRGQYKTVLDNAEARVIVPEDETASRFWGQGTRWCTAATQNCMFAEYHKDGPLYVIMPKHPAHPGEKYQFHFESSQFMDERDEPLAPLDIQDVLNRLPTVRALFAPQALARSLSIFAGPELKAQLSNEAPRLLRNVGAEFGDLRMARWSEVTDPRARLLLDMWSQTAISQLGIDYDEMSDDDQKYVIFNPQLGKASVLDNIWGSVHGPQKISAMTSTMEGKTLAGVIDVLEQHPGEDDPDALRRLNALGIWPGPGSAQRRIARWLHSKGVKNFQ